MLEIDDKQIWVSFCVRFCLENPQIVWDDLTKRYNEPQRHYHTWKHIVNGLAEFEAVQHLAKHPDEVRLACFFHDAIYDSREKDRENVEKSADMAVETMVKVNLPKDMIGRVKDLILATKHDQPPSNIDAQLITDVDLAILGKSEDEFDEYEKNIRLEYEFVSEEASKKGRRKVSERFLARPNIFSTPYFIEKYESQARANLERSIIQLSIFKVRE